MMVNSIHIRPYRSEDAAGISAFMHRCFVNGMPFENRSHSPAYYIWRYAPNYCGTPVVYVVEDSGKIAGMMAVVPKRLWMNGEEILGAESGDTFMDPACKGRNVFLNMASQVFKASHQAGFQVIYGAPNPVSYDVVTQLFGYQELFQYRSWIRPLHFPNIISSRWAFPALPKIVGKPAEWMYDLIFGRSGTSGITLQKIERADERLDRVWKHYRPGIRYSLAKDRKYVDWRFIQSPEDFKVYLILRNLEPAGYAVIKLTRMGKMRCGHIADLFCPDPQIEITHVWRRLITVSKSLDVDFINTWSVVSRTSVRSFKRAGFVRRRKPFWLVMREGHRSLNDFHDIDTPENWLFSQADTDNI